MSMNIIETNALGKRYGSTWALRECTLAIPDGHVAALHDFGGGFVARLFVETDIHTRAGSRVPGLDGRCHLRAFDRLAIHRAVVRGVD